MRSVVVVASTPVLGHAPNLIERSEDVAVQHFGAEGAVEAFDVGILGRLARLDVDQFNDVASSPLAKGGTDEFRAVVQAQASRRTAQFDELIQCPDDAL